MSLLDKILDDANEYFRTHGYPPKRLELFGETYHEFMKEIATSGFQRNLPNYKDINSNKFFGMEIIRKPNETWRIE